jgi:hypothetical protein
MICTCDGRAVPPALSGGLLSYELLAIPAAVAAGVMYTKTPTSPKSNKEGRGRLSMHMNVGIRTEVVQFLFWEYFFRIFGIVSLQCTEYSAFKPRLDDQQGIHLLVSIMKTRESKQYGTVRRKTFAWLALLVLYRGNDAGDCSIFLHGLYRTIPLRK